MTRLPDAQLAALAADPFGTLTAALACECLAWRAACDPMSADAVARVEAAAKASPVYARPDFHGAYTALTALRAQVMGADHG